MPRGFQGWIVPILFFLRLLRLTQFWSNVGDHGLLISIDREAAFALYVTMCIEVQMRILVLVLGYGMVSQREI